MPSSLDFSCITSGIPWRNWASTSFLRLCFLPLGWNPALFARFPSGIVLLLSPSQVQTPAVCCQVCLAPACLCRPLCAVYSRSSVPSCWAPLGWLLTWAMLTHLCRLLHIHIHTPGMLPLSLCSWICPQELPSSQTFSISPSCPALPLPNPFSFPGGF